MASGDELEAQAAVRRITRDHAMGFGPSPADLRLLVDAIRTASATVGEELLSPNLAYLEMQSTMEMVARTYQPVSHLLPTKTDGDASAIGNVR